MVEINLNNIKYHLERFDKIVVTGPPRSGTTIAANIIAKELKYKFIDETFYDGNNSQMFLSLFNIPRKMVIQTTAFLKSLHFRKQ